MSDILTDIHIKKRKMILDILQELGSHWHLSKSVHDFVSSSEVTPDIIDFLWLTIDETLKEIEDGEKNENLLSLSAKMKELRLLEEKEKLEEMNIEKENFIF